MLCPGFVIYAALAVSVFLMIRIVSMRRTQT